MPASANGLKIRILLRETGLAHKEIQLRRDAGENRTPAFVAVSPAGNVPAITDAETGAGVFESAAILIYLAEKAGAYLPDVQPARADVLKWLMFESASLAPACENIYQLCYLEYEGVEASLGFQRDKLRNATALVDAQLAGRDYVAGECSIADFAFFPWMNMLEDFAEIPLGQFPNVARWLDTMHARPAVRGALNP